MEARLAALHTGEAAGAAKALAAGKASEGAPRQPAAGALAETYLHDISHVSPLYLPYISPISGAVAERHDGAAKWGRRQSETLTLTVARHR